MAAISVKTLYRNFWFIVSAGLIAISVAGYLWLTTHYERKPYEIEKGRSQDFYRNPFLAAERYLRLSGKQVESDKGLELLANLPSSRDVLILKTLPSGLSSALNDGLYNWVKAGGRLLMTPGRGQNLNPNTPDFARRIGVRKTEEKKDCGCPPEKAEGGSTKEGAKPVGEAPKTVAVKAAQKDKGTAPFRRIMPITVDSHLIRVEQSSSFLLEDLGGTAYRIEGTYFKEYLKKEDRKLPDHAVLVDSEDAWLLRYSVGSGMVTVLGDMAFMTNTRIAEHDHAFFLSHLVKDADKVWLIYDDEVDSLAVLLLQKMPHFWISLLISLIFVIWMLQLRYGPAAETRRDVSNNILTHVEAIGGYCWRIDCCRLMQEGNRKHFLRRWQKKKSGFAGDADTPEIVLNSREDLKGLAAGTGLTEQDIDDAFRLKHENEQEFIRSSRALQKFGLAMQTGRGERKP